AITDNASLQNPFSGRIGRWIDRLPRKTRTFKGRRPTMTQFDGELSPPFEIVEPESWRAPIIFNSPHSGSVYPLEVLNASRIDLAALRRSEDSFMDELIGHLSERGFPTVRVNFPRSYVDVNREPYELDPRMFTGRLPSFANTRSMRVAGGLGTIPRVVGDGQEIYRERLSVDDALGRIEALYKPYHRALRRLINKAHQAFGTVILVDCHSMPLRHQFRPPFARCRGGNHERARLFDRPQQALCRRIHHRALWQPGERIAHRAARTQPRDLYGRAAARARAPLCASSRRFHRAGGCTGEGAARGSRAVPGGGGIDSILSFRGA